MVGRSSGEEGCQPCDLALQFTVQKMANSVTPSWAAISVEPLHACEAFKAGLDILPACLAVPSTHSASFKVPSWQRTCCSFASWSRIESL